MFGGRRRGGVVRTVGRTAVVAGTATAVVGGVHRRQSRRWADQQEQSNEQQQAAYNQGQLDAQTQQPAPAPAADADYVAQLERLAKLKEQGVLTDQEFAAEKAKILGG